jgi:phage recombination protein Bet
MEPHKVVATLKDSFLKGASDAELVAFVAIANQYQLNPWTKEIHAFKGRGGGIQCVLGIDGWLKIINHHEQMDSIQTELKEDDQGNPVSCTCSIYRKDRRGATVVTEYMVECRQGTEPWQKMPRRMLRHKAIIQCARVAFGFAFQDDDEIQVTSHPGSTTFTVTAPVDKVATTTEAPPQEPAPQKRKRASRTVNKAAQAMADSTPPPPPEEEQEQVDEPETKTPQDLLADFVVACGHDFDTFRHWGTETGNLENDSLAGFDEIPTQLCVRLLRARDGLKSGLDIASTMMKGEA